MPRNYIKKKVSTYDQVDVENAVEQVLAGARIFLPFFNFYFVTYLLFFIKTNKKKINKKNNLTTYPNQLVLLLHLIIKTFLPLFVYKFRLSCNKTIRTELPQLLSRVTPTPRGNSVSWTFGKWPFSPT
jgi:hypothetical protein